MDQFTVAVGKKDNAIFLDTNTLQYEYAPILLEDSKIIITNSKVKHSLVTSEYNVRRQECADALSDLQKELSISSLGELTPEEFEEAEQLVSEEDIDENPEDLLYASEGNYETKEDAYKDTKYSGITFIVFGILGAVYLALCKLDIIPIKYNTFVFIVICALFAGFVLLGIVNCAKASKMKLLIPKEQEKTEKITQWLSENITDAFIEKWTDDSVTEMENDLAITSHIRQSLLHEFPNEEVAFLEYLADKYYSDTFLDE